MISSGMDLNASLFHVHLYHTLKTIDVCIFQLHKINVPSIISGMEKNANISKENVHLELNGMDLHANLLDYVNQDTIKIKKDIVLHFHSNVSHQHIGMVKLVKHLVDVLMVPMQVDNHVNLMYHVKMDIYGILYT